MLHDSGQTSMIMENQDTQEGQVSVPLWGRAAGVLSFIKLRRGDLGQLTVIILRVIGNGSSINYKALLKKSNNVAMHIRDSTRTCATYGMYILMNYCTVCPRMKLSKF